MKPADPGSSTPEKPANQPALAKRLALAAVATLAALAAAELMLRAVHWLRLRAALARLANENGTVVAVESDIPGLIYTYRPHTGGTNAQGYYDEDHDLEKPPEVFRIVVIGDSVAAGQRVGWPNSFGKLLEYRLNQLAAESCAAATDANHHRRGGAGGKARNDRGAPSDVGAQGVIAARVDGEAAAWDSRGNSSAPTGQRKPDVPVDECEVILLARSGYGTAQQLVLLEREAFAYRPDLILWSYVLNDPAHPLYHDVSGDLRLLHHPSCALGHLGKAAWFRVCELLAARRVPDEFHARLHYVYRDRIAKQFARIGRICGEHRVPCVLAIHPVLAGKTPLDRYPLADVHDDLRRLAESAGLQAVDLTPAYGARLPSEVGYPDDPWHPNALGHQLAADDLAEQLVELGLVPWRPPMAQNTNSDR